MKRKNSYQKGVLAEFYASLFLMCTGYSILKKRYKTPFGEIDLLCRKGKSLVCVEVKYRSNLDAALEAVNLKTQRRIIMAAEFFRSHNLKYQDYDVRFDIIAIRPTLLGFRHLKNAWYAH